MHIGALARNAWTTYGPRLIGVAAGWVVARFVVAPLEAHGLSVSPEQQEQARALLSGAIDGATGLLATYLLTHRTASKRINPGDASSGHLAEIEKGEKKTIVAAERRAEVEDAIKSAYIARHGEPPL